MITTNSVVYGQEIEEEPEQQLDLLEMIYGKDSLVDHVLKNREKYRFQFMVTDVFEQDSTFYLGETYNYVRPDWYFYPASVVKLPTAILSLEKLNEANFPTESILVLKDDYHC
ncbi:MAG: hypothetical protein AB8B56_11690, partial [Crocinitomicaceae bacterium]